MIPAIVPLTATLPTMVVKRVDGKEGVTESEVEVAPQAGVVVVDPLLNVAIDVDVGLVHDPGLGQGLAIDDVKVCRLDGNFELLFELIL